MRVAPAAALFLLPLAAGAPGVFPPANLPETPKVSAPSGGSRTPGITAADADEAALLSGAEILLWPGAAPGSEGLALEERITERSGDPGRHDRIVTGIVRPSLRLHRPERPNGAAVIVVPGGAYQRVVVDKEGRDVCEWLNGLGVAAFILKYRLPDEGHRGAADVPLQDGQRAVRVVRNRAASLGIDPHRVGVIGFSAGGHLAGTLAAYSDASVYAPVDDADRGSARPDFVILAYPVVGSRTSPPGSRPGGLATSSPREQVIAKYPVDVGVGPDSPPAFLFHAGEDASVSAEGSVRVFLALRAARVPAEIHVFRGAGHGFGIRDAAGPLAQWPTLCAEWMRGLGLLDAR